MWKLSSIERPEGSKPEVARERDLCYFFRQTRISARLVEPVRTSATGQAVDLQLLDEAAAGLIATDLRLLEVQQVIQRLL